MPLVSLPMIGFALGAGLSAITMEALSRSTRLLSAPALVIVSVLGGLGFAPSVSFLVGLAPAWAAGYWFEPLALPAWALPLWSLLNAVVVPLGFALCSYCQRLFGRNTIRAWIVVSSTGAVLPLVVFWHRTSVFATYEQFRGDFAVQPVVGTAFGYAIVWYVIGILVASWWAWRSLKYLAQGGAQGA